MADVAEVRVMVDVADVSRWLEVEVSARYRQLGIPPLYEGASVRDFTPAQLQFWTRGAWEVSPSLETFPRLGDPKNWLLTGANGAGKSHLAAALAVIYGYCWRNCYDVAKEVDAARSFRSELSEVGVLKKLASIPLLVFDDFSSIQRNEAALAALHRIIDLRLENETPTIVTSYLELEDIDGLDSSLASRLGAYDVIRVVYDGETGDRRLDR